MRRHVPLLIAIFFFAAAFFGWRSLQKERELDKPEVLLARLPTRDAVVLSIDFAALRRGGIFDVLAKSKVPEEPEYKTFVHDSNFDYKRDLDSALVAFAPDGEFFLVRGRFDWRKLAEYAKLHGGSCYNDLCRLTGSAPNRRISFVPLREDLMALAVSGDDLAASRLKQPGPQRAISVPAQPVWLSVPSNALRNTSSSAGTRLFTASVSNAEDVTLTLGPDGNAFQLRLEALCRSSQDAATMLEQLEKTTAILRNGLRNGTPRNGSKSNAADDLSGILTEGVFRQSERKVIGHWAVQKSFLDNLAGGI